MSDTQNITLSLPRALLKRVKRLAAIAIQQQANLSFGDAMVVRAAAETQCDVLWTEDLNDGQSIRGVRIRNPFIGS